MPIVTCDNCSESMPVPGDLALSHCVRCGRVMRVSANSVDDISQAIRPEAAPTWSPKVGGVSSGPRREPYADWDDFRANAPSVQRALADLATRALPDLRRAELESLPADLPTAADSLGLPVASFTLPGENRGLYIVDALAVCIGASILLLVLLPGLLEIRLSPLVERLLFLVLFSAGFLTAAAWLILQIRKSRLTCWILENGVVWQQDGSIRAARWCDVRNLLNTSETAARRCVLDLGMSQRIVIDAASEPAFMLLIEFIETKATAAQLLQRLQAIVTNNRAEFGAVILDRDGLHTSTFDASWPRMTKVVADHAKLLVDCRDFTGWREVPYRFVSFPLLVMIISHIMIEEYPWLPPIGDSRVTEVNQ